MHPDLIRALGRERHAELLRSRQIRDPRHAVDAVVSDLTRRRRPAGHLRRSVGAALVQAGSRLLAQNQTAADWAVPGSGESTRP
jgi:hypothetical protein